MTSSAPSSTPWRTEKDRALLTLESGRRSRERVDAAHIIVELALESRDRADELAGLLPRLLDDKDDRVRRAGVALAAVVLPPEEAETLFANRMKDESVEVRVESVGQLADLARPSSRGLFAAAMQDPAFTVRFEGARGMAALHHPAGVDVLIEALRKDAFRFRALSALAELGDRSAIEPIRRIHTRFLMNPWERTQAAGALVRLGETSAGGWLMERVQRKRGSDRPMAVELIGELKLPGAKERLLQILGDPKDGSRGAAARALGRLGDPSVIDALAAVLGSTEAPEFLRLDAAEGLLLLQTPEARAKVEPYAALNPDSAFAHEVRSLLEDYAA